jgi:hypothetical protein
VPGCCQRPQEQRFFASFFQKRSAFLLYFFDCESGPAGMTVGGLSFAADVFYSFVAK